MFGHSGLDFVLVNVLLAGCWLLAAFVFFFSPFPVSYHFISFHLISSHFVPYLLPHKTTAKINEHDPIFGGSACQMDRDHQDHAAFGIEWIKILGFKKDKKHSQKNNPKKVVLLMNYSRE